MVGMRNTMGYLDKNLDSFKARKMVDPGKSRRVYHSSAKLGHI